jgi:hypothetical protein
MFKASFTQERFHFDNKAENAPLSVGQSLQQ